MRTRADLHDGSTIDIEVAGDGPNLLLPVRPDPVEGSQAEEMRKWGADPALGRNLIDGLAGVARVVAFDYEGHVLAQPMPETLTPANITSDFLAVADAAGAATFAYYGYSWLAMVGLQVALATDRCAGLAMGGYPPLDGPNDEMLRVTRIGYELATGARPSGNEDAWANAALAPDQARQMVTLYESIRDFDDRAALPKLTIPRLCFAGSKDEIQYGPTWGDVFVSLVEPTIRNRAELEAAGWQVRILEGLDHTGAMQAKAVLPVLRQWLESLGGHEAETR